MEQENRDNGADGDSPDDGSPLACVIDGNSYFSRSKRLGPVMPRLLANVLRGIPLGRAYNDLETVAKRLLQQPSFPDLVLTEDQFQKFERHVINMDDWEQEEKDDAFRYALYHLRRCLNVDPYALPPLVSDAKLRAKYHTQLRSVMGYLAIAWQFKRGMYGQDLILSYADFVRAHPACAPDKNSPPHA